jgi:glutathione S-transferase
MRIVLNIKGVPWESHVVDLRKKRNNEAWFLGINPRGLVPVLIHDGSVHIESNDIVMYLDEYFPDPRLVPEGREDEMARLLKDEDDLHLDLRNLTMRYVIPPDVVGKSPEVLANYRRYGSGTVQGASDTRKTIELDYWERFNAEDGITDEAVAASAQRFRKEFDELETILAKQEFLFFDSLSLLDVAWFVYVTRMKLASYPIETLHPRVDSWYESLKSRPVFSEEAQVPDQVRAQLAERRVREANEGKSLVQLTGFSV